jgi:hypothetical protein
MAGSGEFDEAHKVGEQLVVSRGGAAQLFELVEEAPDDVAFLVGRRRGNSSDIYVSGP